MYGIVNNLCACKFHATLDQFLTIIIYYVRMNIMYNVHMHEQIKFRWGLL